MRPPRRGGATGSAPVRTCVGCRGRDEQAALLRIVVDRPPGPSGPVLVVDEVRRRPGRGAYVHPSTACVQRAVERNAFGRALRTGGRPDADAVRAWLAQQA